MGVVQGLTEYLPVSSSAHLVLLPKLMGWQFLPKEAFIFDVLVQLGTLLGVVLYFLVPLKEVASSILVGIWRRDPFHNDDARLGWLVALASVPAAICGFLFKSEISAYFSNPLVSCYFLLLTAFLLVFAEWVSRTAKRNPSGFDAVFIGCAQSLALFPGLSRSGATIAAGMACGLQRKDAARFSFLMSIPIMVGASLVASFDLFADGEMLSFMITPLLLGFTSAAITGYVVIHWFMNFLTKRRLLWFAAYCFVVGCGGIVMFS